MAEITDRAESASILDLVHDSVIIRDSNGTILKWNTAAEKLYGWSHAEAVGRQLSDLFPQAMAAEAMAELIAKGTWEGEVSRAARDGRALIVDLRWSRRHAPDGSEQIVETGRDVSDRRAAEAALRLNDYRFRNLFEAMAVSFWEIDFTGVGALLLPLRAQGVTDLRAHLAAHPELIRATLRAARVVDVNAKTLELFGATAKGEIIGGDVERYWPRESESLFVEALARTLEKQPHLIRETRLLDLQGNDIEVLFTVSWSAESRKQGVILLGVIDIRDRVRAERTLRTLQADFAHAARVTTLGELTASIAHEVNQPLAAIAANAGAGLRWLDRPTPDVAEASELLSRIVTDSRRAADIIQRIRSMAERREPVPTALSINALVEETLLFLRLDLQYHDVTAAVELAPELPAVHADRVQIQQVLVNLAVNAAQAMRDTGGGRLDIATEALPDGIRIVVEDEGPGLEQEQLARLFEGFFTTKATGMGMGLPICRSILQAHGGDIAASNRSDRSGARFVLTLPAEDRPIRRS